LFKIKPLRPLFYGPFFIRQPLFLTTKSLGVTTTPVLAQT
jgi:hypothetical protein